MYKQLKIIKGEVIDGYEENSDNDNWTIFVNVEHLWNRASAHAIDKFIKMFTNTYTHEVLHIVISNMYEDLEEKYGLGEEFTVWFLMDEKMSNATRKYYEHEYE